MTRDELQGIAAHRLAKSKRLICEWATGTGKSNVALRFLKDNPGMRCLVLVPEQNNIENWSAEFEKFNVPMNNVTIACYASLHKYENTTWDLLVLDEVPHMDTEKRMRILLSVRGEYVLALGAVVDDDEKTSLTAVYGHFESSKIGLEKAIEMNILPPPRVYILHLQLDDTKKTEWYRGKVYTLKELYDVLKAKVDKAVSDYELNSSPMNKRRMFTAGNERKRFLGNQKENAIRRICEHLKSKDKRFLCFCASIDQANKLGGENAFTSKSAKSFYHLDKFNNHEINSLYVVGKLIEGQNLRDIDCGIIGQLGGTARITVQECGRIMRSANPVIYIPIFDGTKDESFLYTLTSNIPADYIKHYNF